MISSKDDTLKIIVPISEGRLFRVGELKVEGNSIFSEQQILGFIGLKKGEIADGKRLQDAVYEDLKKLYGSQGFVNYSAEYNPVFRDNPENPNEGIVDITITIEEDRQFRLRRLEFTGNTFTRDRVLRREFLINEGDIYNQISLERSVIRINQTQYFDPVDQDKDVEIRTNEDHGDVDLIVSVRERGRQQISLNGGLSGIGGSFFGLEYSTNNLLGRGETLSLNFGLGNRQQQLSFTFQNPYFRDRPIAVGFSLFASKYKFFGEGTFLTQNTDLLAQISDPLSQLTTNEDNLFTQTTYGASVFATSQLSELFFKKSAFSNFSRIGVSYQFSATTITDPPVNSLGNPDLAIPVIFAQPNIITSRITPTFVYDTRQPSANGIDTLKGRQISASFAFAGLGGDVRTYQPTITYTHFIPIRNKRSDRAEVFGFRLQAGTVGSFATSDKIKNANSLSFVGGIPIFERYFLGSEYDIRGYSTRSVGPIAAFNSYVTSQNVTLSQTATGDAVAVPGLNARDASEIAALGLLTGAGGTNPSLLNNNFQFIGGDTQLLGNFEYRIPVFGPVALAAFADIGTVFNLRKTGTQTINSNFLADDVFIGAGLLTALSTRNAPEYNNFNSLFLFNNRPATTDIYREACNLAGVICPSSIPAGFQQVYLRGEVQTNRLLEVDSAAFDGIKDYRASVGLELRVQVPVVNVPFRLIYFYNPNAKFGQLAELPGLNLPGKKSGLRFTVGRTF